MQMRCRLDLTQVLNGFDRICHEIAVTIEDIQHRMRMRLHHSREATKRRSAHVVATQIDDDEMLAIRILERGYDGARETRHVEARPGLREDRCDKMHASLLEQAALLARAEVRVDDVEIDERHRTSIAHEVEGEVDGKIGLAGSVMTSDDRDGGESRLERARQAAHQTRPSLFSFSSLSRIAARRILPLTVLGSSST